MKKGIAISIIVITVLVSGYNIYQYLNSYGVKIGDTEQQISKPQPETSGNGDKTILAAYIVINFGFFLFYSIRSIIYIANPKIAWVTFSGRTIHPSWFYYTFHGSDDINKGSAFAPQITSVFAIIFNGVALFIILTDSLSKHL